MVTQIQIEFLWGGVGGGQKVCWVKWRKVCQPRSKGCEDGEFESLGKVEQPLWKRVLVEKYGDHVRGMAPCEGVRWPRFTYLWWRNLMSLEEGIGGNWFTNKVWRKKGNGRNTSFWVDRWVREVPLFNLFPKLYSLSNQKEAKVWEVVTFQGVGRFWNITWRQPFMWEANLIDNLLALLEDVVSESNEDRWVWLQDEGGMFSVKSVYSILEKNLSCGRGCGCVREWFFFFALEDPDSVQSGGVLVVLTP